MCLDSLRYERKLQVPPSRITPGGLVDFGQKASFLCRRFCMLPHWRRPSIEESVLRSNGNYWLTGEQNKTDFEGESFLARVIMTIDSQ